MMALDDLLTLLEQRAAATSVTPVTPAENAGVTPRPAPIRACTRVTPVTPENSVTANKVATSSSEDTWRICNECANLDPEGHCLGATALGASRNYRPVRDQPRHCEAFQARPGEPNWHERSLERLGTLALEQESRRLKVLAMLDADPTLRSAYVVDSDSDPDHVIVTIAARGWITCDISIPRAKYDPFQVMALMANLRPVSKSTGESFH